MTLNGAAQMLRIYFGEDDRWNGKPLYQAIVEEARQRDLAGATVYRGIEGDGASSRIHRKPLLPPSDLPIMVCIVDEAVRVQAFLPVLEGMVSEGLIAISNVEATRSTTRATP